MKKHYIILGIALFGGIFALVVYFIQGKDRVDEPGNDLNESTLTLRIENMGKEAFSKEGYQALVNEVEGLKSAEVINSDQAILYRQNLLINLQSSLALTFDQARINCYENNLIAAHQAADSIHNKIQKLTSALIDHNNYNIAMGYQGRLNTFLSGWYDDQKAKAIKNSFTSFISGKPFAQCDKIQTLRQTIDKELKNLESFNNNYNYYIKENANPNKDMYNEEDYPSSYNALRRYKAYWNHFNSIP